MVVTFGDQPVSFLPGIDWTFRPALSAPTLIAEGPDHTFHDQVPVLDQIWHHHGVLRPPTGADVILATEDNMGVLYLDRVSTAGTLIVTCLDPIAHFGSYFMPATERFLDGFLPWVSEVLLGRPKAEA